MASSSVPVAKTPPRLPRQHHGYPGKQKCFVTNSLSTVHILHNSEHALPGPLDGSYLTHNYSWADVFTHSDSSFISVCVFRRAVWVELHTNTDTIIVQRGSISRSLSHWPVRVVLPTDTPPNISDDSGLSNTHTHTKAPYPAPSWPCTGPQHLRWRWSLRWVSLFLCWPATQRQRQIISLVRRFKTFDFG